jgi:hypothetical protein
MPQYLVAIHHPTITTGPPGAKRSNLALNLSSPVSHK